MGGCGCGGKDDEYLAVEFPDIDGTVADPLIPPLPILLPAPPIPLPALPAPVPAPPILLPLAALALVSPPAVETPPRLFLFALLPGRYGHSDAA